MSFKRILLKGLKYLAIVLVSLISLMITINLSIFDEELRPEVKEILANSEVPKEGNAYFASMGLFAAPDKDISKVGVERMEHYLNNGLNKDSYSLSKEESTLIFGDIQIYKNFNREPPCKSRTKIGCVKELIKKEQDNSFKSENLTLLLKRYQEIQKMKQYKPITELTFNTPNPNYGGILRLNRFNLAQFYISNKGSSFIDEVENDLAYWKMVLNDENTLIDKMIAVSAMRTGLRFLSEYISTHNLSENEKNKINLILINLTKDELNIFEAFKFELRYANGVFNNLYGANNKWWENSLLFFIQKNATANSVYMRDTLTMKCLNKLTAPELSFEVLHIRKDKYVAIGKNYKCFKPYIKLVNFSPDSLYNIGGKILISSGTIGFIGGNYIARVHDLNGVISLVKLQLELKNIAKEDIEKTIKDSSIRNLYTGEPMNYDKDKNEIGFDCLDKGLVCTIKL